MPETSFQAAIRSSRGRIGVSESVPWGSTPAAAREVVDDGYVVAARREAHRGRPAEVAVAPEDEDAHRGRQGSSGMPVRRRRRPVATAYSGRRPCLLTLASIFPAELTALRAAGLVFAVLLIAFGIWRRRELSNGAVLLAFLGGLALAIVSGTELVNKLLEVFAFERGNGERILGLAVFAIAILFLLVLRALTESARMNQQLSALLEGLAWEEFKGAKLPERFRDKVAVVIPAYDEADSVAAVIERDPERSAGSRRGSWWWTTARATRPATRPRAPARSSPGT